MALRSVLSSGVGVSLGRPATRRSRACTGPLRVVASQQQARAGGESPHIGRRRALQLATAAALVAPRGVRAEEEAAEAVVEELGNKPIFLEGVEELAPPPLEAQVDSRLATNLTEEERIILEYNQRIALFNRAPKDFPSFVRIGYQVRVLTNDGYVEQSNGLIYKDYEVGTGSKPLDGQQVVFNYTAYNESGATIDSTYRKDRPAETRLGIGGMIPGFEEGIKSMRNGGKRRIVVPPELGPPVGPSTFFSSRQFEVFDVELISISDCERKNTAFIVSKVVCETPQYAPGPFPAK